MLSIMTVGLGWLNYFGTLVQASLVVESPIVTIKTGSAGFWSSPDGVPTIRTA